MFIIVSLPSLLSATSLINVKLGLVTVCFGSSLWWILPDSPHTAKFLTERERVIAVERLKSNKTGVKNVHHKQYQVFEALRDVKVWMLVAAIFFHNMTNSLQTTVSSVLDHTPSYP
jgi:ACS family allantoate permease-like MFS transporter